MRTVRGHTRTDAARRRKERRSRCWEQQQTGWAEERRGGGAPLCVRDNTPTLSLSLSSPPSPPAGDKLTESSCRLFQRRGGRLAAQGSRFCLFSFFFLVRSFPGTPPTPPLHRTLRPEHRGAAPPHAGHSALQDGQTCCRGLPVAAALRRFEMQFRDVWEVRTVHQHRPLSPQPPAPTPHRAAL